MTPTPTPLPPEITVRIVSRGSWVSTYGSLVVASVALIAALITLGGVFLSNRAAAKRQLADIAAAENRRVRDAADVEERERERHRRESMAVNISNMIATALGIIPIATNLKGRRPNEADALKSKLVAEVDKVVSLNYQLLMLAPAERMTEALQKVVDASKRLSSQVETLPSPEHDTTNFDSDVTQLRAAAENAVIVYRAVYAGWRRSRSLPTPSSHPE